MEEPPYLNVNMDLHPECRISNYLFQIQKITGPFSDFQLDCFKDLSENQEIKIRTADTKRETRELMENARNKKSKSRPAWLSPRELEINYYEAGGDQGCGPFSSYKMTNNGFGTYTERTVRKCCHHYHSPRKENHQPETEKRKGAATALDDLVSKYFSKKTKEEVTQTDNNVRTGATQTEYKAIRTGATQTEATDLEPLDVDKLKDLMKKAVRRVKDTSIVSVEEFLKLCIDEIELNSIKDQVKKARINLDLNGKLAADYGNEEMSAFDARMLSVIDSTLAVCRERLREFPTQARNNILTPRHKNLAQSKDFRSYSETSREITDQLYHQCGGENDRYKYEERDVRQERSVKEPYVSTKANEQLYKDVREMYREHAENESMPHTSQKSRKADDSKKKKKKERHKPELENSTPISHPSTLSYYMQESARPINWVVEESDRDFLDDHYNRDVLAVPRLDLDFTREDDPVELSAHSSSSSYWSEASKESMRDWLKSKGIQVFDKDDWDEISVFSSPDKAKEDIGEQETVDVSKKHVLQQVNQKMQVAGPRQDLNGYVDSSSSDDSSLLNSSDRELLKTQYERTGRWALATHKYMDLKQMRGDIDEMFHDSESSVISDRGSSVLSNWTSLSQRKSNRYDEGNGREYEIAEVQVGKEVMHGYVNNFERLHLEDFSDISEGRKALSTIEEVSVCEDEQPFNVQGDVSVCQQSDWSNEKLSFTSSEKGQIDAFVSKDEKIDMNLTYQERFEERRQKAIDDLLAPDTSEEEFEVPDRQTQFRKPEVSKKSRQRTMPPVKLSIEAQMSISIGGNIESISSLGPKESNVMMMMTDSSSESDESEFYQFYQNKTAVVQNKGLHMESSKRKEQFMKQHTKDSAYIDDELESRQEDKRGVTKARSKRSCEKGYNVVEQIQRDNNTDNEKMLTKKKETKSEHKHKLEADNAKSTKHQVETVENKKPSSVKQSMNDTKKPVNRGVDVEYGQDVHRAKEEKNQKQRRLSETKNDEKTDQEEMKIEVATKMTKRTDITRHEMPGSVTQKKSYQENCKLKGASNQNIEAKQFKDAQNTDTVNNKSETLRMGRSKKKDKTGRDERKHENNQDIDTNINDSKMLVSKRAEQTNGQLEHANGTRVQSESCDRRIDKAKRKSKLHSKKPRSDDFESIDMERKQMKPNGKDDLFKEYALECMDEHNTPIQTRNENDAMALGGKKHQEQNMKGANANERNTSDGRLAPLDKTNKVSDGKRMKSEHDNTEKGSTSDYQKYPNDVMQPVHKHKIESKEIIDRPRSEKLNVVKTEEKMSLSSFASSEGLSAGQNKTQTENNQADRREIAEIDSWRSDTSSSIYEPIMTKGQTTTKAHELTKKKEAFVKPKKDKISEAIEIESWRSDTDSCIDEPMRKGSLVSKDKDTGKIEKSLPSAKQQTVKVNETKANPSSIEKMGLSKAGNEDENFRGKDDDHKTIAKKIQKSIVPEEIKQQTTKRAEVILESSDESESWDSSDEDRSRQNVDKGQAETKSKKTESKKVKSGKPAEVVKKSGEKGKRLKNKNAESSPSRSNIYQEMVKIAKTVDENQKKSETLKDVNNIELHGHSDAMSVKKASGKPNQVDGAKAAKTGDNLNESDDSLDSDCEMEKQIYHMAVKGNITEKFYEETKRNVDLKTDPELNICPTQNEMSKPVTVASKMETETQKLCDDSKNFETGKIDPKTVDVEVSVSPSLSKQTKVRKAKSDASSEVSSESCSWIDDGRKEKEKEHKDEKLKGSGDSSYGSDKPQDKHGIWDGATVNGNEDVTEYDEYYIHDESVDAERALLIAAIEGTPTEEEEAYYTDLVDHVPTDKIDNDGASGLVHKSSCSDLSENEEVYKGRVMEVFSDSSVTDMSTHEREKWVARKTEIAKEVPNDVKFAEQYEEQNVQRSVEKEMVEEAPKDVINTHTLQMAEISNQSVNEQAYAKRPLSSPATALKAVASPLGGIGLTKTGMLPLKNTNIMQGKQSFLEASKDIFALEKSIASGGLSPQANDANVKTNKPEQSNRITPRGGLLEPIKASKDKPVTSPNRHGAFAPLCSTNNAPIAQLQRHGTLAPLGSTNDAPMISPPVRHGTLAPLGSKNDSPIAPPMRNGTLAPVGSTNGAPIAEPQRHGSLAPLGSTNDALFGQPQRHGTLAPLSPFRDPSIVPPQRQGILKPLESSLEEKSKKGENSKKKKDKKAKKAKKRQKELPPVIDNGLNSSLHRNLPFEAQRFENPLSQFGVLDVHQYEDEELEQLRNAMIEYAYAQDDHYGEAYVENPYACLNIPEEFQNNPEEYIRLLEELQASEELQGQYQHMLDIPQNIPYADEGHPERYENISEEHQPSSYQQVSLGRRKLRSGHQEMPIRTGNMPGHPPNFPPRYQDMPGAHRDLPQGYQDTPDAFHNLLREYRGMPPVHHNMPRGIPGGHQQNLPHHPSNISHGFPSVPGGHLHRHMEPENLPTGYPKVGGMPAGQHPNPQSFPREIPNMHDARAVASTGMHPESPRSLGNIEYPKIRGMTVPPANQQSSLRDIPTISGARAADSSGIKPESPRGSSIIGHQIKRGIPVEQHPNQHNSLRGIPNVIDTRAEASRGIKPKSLLGRRNMAPPRAQQNVGLAIPNKPRDFQNKSNGALDIPVEHLRQNFRNSLESRQMDDDFVINNEYETTDSERD